ncbi:hypothetical protein D4Q52_05090 [Rhodopseudomonas palustris]|uniref:Uncharacterized protein n=1 Tax=Rhodopseudomonas palustris TaxID=1076 RepID=A0A418VK57_RHOPL|nr:hypothetical protein D4Q52_05090 [Rhodopseudomonas palustris]
MARPLLLAQSVIAGLDPANHRTNDKAPERSGALLCEWGVLVYKIEPLASADIVAIWPDRTYRTVLRYDVNAPIELPD